LTGGFGPYGKPDEDAGRRPRRPDGPPRGSADRAAKRPALRTVGERAKPRTSSSTRTARPPSQAETKRRRRRTGPADVDVEIRRLAGRNGDRFLKLLMQAADAFANDRPRDALRIVRPLREQIPDSPSVRELVGLSHYRLGNYAAAAKEIEAYAQLSGSVDQNAVLMDCYRAQRRYKKVEQAWDELAQVSPSAEAVAEGRIVWAGSLADQGKLSQALASLRKRGQNQRNPKEHHLRLWYALADLEERAGNNAVARDLFDRVGRADASYADVAERRAALS
jgi:tetratricopeptide (TPR) repeat protein